MRRQSFQDGAVAFDLREFIESGRWRSRYLGHEVPDYEGILDALACFECLIREERKYVSAELRDSKRSETRES